MTQTTRSSALHATKDKHGPAKSTQLIDACAPATESSHAGCSSPCRCCCCDITNVTQFMIIMNLEAVAACYAEACQLGLCNPLSSQQCTNSLPAHTPPLTTAAAPLLDLHGAGMNDVLAIPWGSLSQHHSSLYPCCGTSVGSNCITKYQICLQDRQHSSVLCAAAPQHHH